MRFASNIVSTKLAPNTRKRKSQKRSQEWNRRLKLSFHTYPGNMEGLLFGSSTAMAAWMAGVILEYSPSPTPKPEHLTVRCPDPEAGPWTSQGQAWMGREENYDDLAHSGHWRNCFGVD